MNDNILEVDRLCVTYSRTEGDFRAVHEVSFALGTNESLGIIGESGCGKSTLAFSIMHHLPPTASINGSIRFKDHDILKMTVRQVQSYRGNRIAMVYQNPYSSLNPSLTIGRQLDEIGFIHRKLSKHEARKASIEVLELMNIGDPERIIKRYPHQISGGIQQRICIGMAVLCRPDVMILDEPTTALDVTTEAVILDLLNTLRDELHMSLIYISHDMGVINKVADNIAVMYSGEIVEQGSKVDVFNHPMHPYSRALINCMPRGGVVKEAVLLNTIPGYVQKRSSNAMGCPFASRCLKRTTTCEVQYGKHEFSSGHRATCDRAYATDVPDVSKRQRTLVMQPMAESPPRPSLLDMIDVTKQYGLHRKVYAVNGIDLHVEPGAVLGIVGESGCGKSTTAHMVAGLYRPTSGKILFDGTDISIPWNKRTPKILKDIQLIFQNPGNSLNPSHTVEQLISRPMKRLLGMKTAQERRMKIVQMLEKVDLSSEYLKKKPRQLSGGEQQRVAIARALSISPQLIVCDEPTSALDVSVQAAVLNLLHELQQKTMMSYLFISHDLNVVNYISDRIVVMYAGKVVEYGTRDEIMKTARHPYTEALLSSIPDTDPTYERVEIRLEGQLPDPGKKTEGCPFAGRCHKQLGEICHRVEPPKVSLSPTHQVFCHRTFNAEKSASA